MDREFEGNVTSMEKENGLCRIIIGSIYTDFAYEVLVPQIAYELININLQVFKKLNPKYELIKTPARINFNSRKLAIVFSGPIIYTISFTCHSIKKN